MYRYRVDYYVGDKVFGSTYVDAWSRREAYYDTIRSNLFNGAVAEANRTYKEWGWDATRLTHLDEI